MPVYGTYSRRRPATESEVEIRAKVAYQRWVMYGTISFITVSLLVFANKYADGRVPGMELGSPLPEPNLNAEKDEGHPPTIYHGSPPGAWANTTRDEPMQDIKWGIAGLGRIAHEFAVALHVSGASIQAVAAGSLPRKQARSVVFADQFGVDLHHAYDSYEKLVKDTEVDIIYIATTNNLHHKVALLAISHGKHVLVEKPTAMNSREVEEMTEAARKKGVFFASNYWNSAFPAVRFAREAIRQGKIGEIVQVTGDMGFQAVTNYQDRWLSAELGGGGLMDMGCYLLHFLVMMTNEQKGVNVSAKIDIDNAIGRLDPNTKVDLDTSYTAEYNGVVGRFGTSIIRASPFTVQIMGTQGMITIESPANCPTEASLVAFWDASRTSFMPYPCCVQPLAESRDFSEDLPPYPRQFFPQQYPRGTGFVYIIEAVTECLRAGCKELPDVPQETALKIQQAVDAIRSEVQKKSNRR